MKLTGKMTPNNAENRAKLTRGSSYAVCYTHCRLIRTEIITGYWNGSNFEWNPGKFIQPKIEPQFEGSGLEHHKIIGWVKIADLQIEE